jgi:hypothetical protein
VSHPERLTSNTMPVADLRELIYESRSLLIRAIRNPHSEHRGNVKAAASALRWAKARLRANAAIDERCEGIGGGA